MLFITKYESKREEFAFGTVNGIFVGLDNGKAGEGEKLLMKK